MEEITLQPTRSRAWLLALLLVLGLVAAACGSSDDTAGTTPDEDAADTTDSKLEDRAPGGTLVYGADQEPTGFNGNTSKDNGTSVKNVIESIHFFTAKATPDFQLDYIGLEGEPKVISEDPQTIEWELNKDAVWSDGTPVTTDDIKYFFDTIEAKDTAKVTEDNPKGYVNDVASHVGYDQVKELKVIDKKKLQVIFSETYADYRGMFAEGVPQAAFMKAQPGGWDTGLDAHPGPSAGPFVFKEYKKGESLTLEKNPKWWGKVKPTLDTIVFRFLPESTTQPDALRNNEVDMVYPQPQLDLVDQVKQLSDVKSEIGFGPVFEHLTFNFQNEFLKDLAVRQAIAHGVDRNAIVEALMKPFSDKASRLDNRVLVGNQKGYKANGKEYQTADVAKAAKVLTDAGYAKGADGIFAKGGKKISIRLSTTAGNEVREQQGELIKAQLAKVGIEIKIDNSPSTVLFGTRLPAGDFDIANFAWVGSVFPLSGAQQIYETGSDSNYGKYSNADLDKLVKEASGELDADKALAIADKEDVAMWKDLVNLPLYQKPTFLGVRTKFVNVIDNTTNEGPFFNSQEWGLKKTAA